MPGDETTIQRKQDITKANATVIRALDLKFASVELKVKDGRIVELVLSEKIDLKN